MLRSRLGARDPWSSAGTSLKRKRSLNDSHVDLTKLKTAVRALQELADELAGIRETEGALAGIVEGVDALQAMLARAQDAVRPGPTRRCRRPSPFVPRQSTPPPSARTTWRASASRAACSSSGATGCSRARGRCRGAASTGCAAQSGGSATA